jgi:hypothetical protein
MSGTYDSSGTLACAELEFTSRLVGDGATPGNTGTIAGSAIGIGGSLATRGGGGAPCIGRTGAMPLGRGDGRGGVGLRCEASGTGARLMDDGFGAGDDSEVVVVSIFGAESVSESLGKSVSPMGTLPSEARNLSWRLVTAP